MKKKFLLITTLITLFFSVPQFVKAQYLKYEPLGTVSNQKLPNGSYNALVSYSNTSTKHSANYSLKVDVQYGRVTAIHFGNEGSVHNGYNNSGYFYNGGDLRFQYDSDGDITSATTRVTIIDKSGNTLIYNISLK